MPEQRNESSAAQGRHEDDPIIVVEYEGTFDLCWLWPGERVGSAGDETGACIIYRADGSEHRVNIGDLIEVAALLDEEDDRA